MGKVSTSTGFLAGFLNHQPSGSGRISPSTVSPPSPKVPAALRSSLLLSRLFFVPTFQGGKKNGKSDGESATVYKQKDAKHANFDKKTTKQKHLQTSSKQQHQQKCDVTTTLVSEHGKFGWFRVETRFWTKLLTFLQSASAEGSCLAHVVTFSKPRSPKMCWVRMGKVRHQNLHSRTTSSFQKKRIHRISNTVKQPKKTSVNLVKSFNFELVGVELPIPKKCLKKLSFNFLHPYHPWDNCIFTYIDPIKINHSCRCIYIYIYTWILNGPWERNMKLPAPHPNTRLSNELLPKGSVRFAHRWFCSIWWI